MLPQLTVIVPTIPGRESQLHQTLAALTRQTIGLKAFRVIVAWDAEAPPPSLAFPGMHLEVITQGSRRGQASARNAAVARTQTRLGLFLDDDIVVVPEFLELHLALHRREPSPLVLGVGSVSWDGHPNFNVIMRWWQTMGGYSLFVSLEDGQYCPMLPSGVTSFKTETLRAFRFDETFTTYGREDSELGDRLFRAGARAIFIKGAHGLHLKEVSARSYYRDHVEGGQSEITVYDLHPDAVSHPRRVPAIIALRKLDADRARLLDMAETIALSRVEPGGLPELLHEVMEMVTRLAIAEGWRQRASARFPGFDAAADILADLSPDDVASRQAVTLRAARLCPDFAMLWLLAAENQTDPSVADECIARARAVMPHYALACFMDIRSRPPGGGAACAQEVETFLSNHGATLTREKWLRYSLEFGREIARRGAYTEGLPLLDLAARQEPWTEIDRNTVATAALTAAWTARQLGQADMESEYLTMVLQRQPEQVLARLFEAQRLQHTDPDASRRSRRIAKDMIPRRPVGERALLREFEAHLARAMESGAASAPDFPYFDRLAPATPLVRAR